MPNTKKASSSFKKSESYSPRNNQERLLVKALLSAKDEAEMTNLLRDLLTIAEIEEFANRIKIVKLLLEGHSYIEIAHEVKTSTTTVTRVAHWLYNGCGGYYNVLRRVLKK